MKNKKILYTTLGMMICAFILTLTVFAGCGSDGGGVTNAGNFGNISNTPTSTPTPGATATPTVYITQSGNYSYYYSYSPPGKVTSSATGGAAIFPTPTNVNNYMSVDFTLTNTSVNIADLNIDAIIIKNENNFPVNDVEQGSCPVTGFDSNWTRDTSYTSGIKFKKGDNYLAAGTNYTLKIYFTQNESSYFTNSPSVKLYLYSNGVEVGYVLLQQAV